MRASRATDAVRRSAGFAVIAALAIIGTGCGRDTLPQSDTYEARLYVERCGQCHPAYNPHQLTAAMWETQVDAMQPKIEQAGLAPLTADERAAILDYLRRNAGTQ